MKDLVRRSEVEDRMLAASAANRTDEIGSDTYIGTRNELNAMGYRNVIEFDGIKDWRGAVTKE